MEKHTLSAIFPSLHTRLLLPAHLASVPLWSRAFTSYSRLRVESGTFRTKQFLPLLNLSLNELLCRLLFSPVELFIYARNHLIPILNHVGSKSGAPRQRLPDARSFKKGVNL
jgi:hypothetical protein